MTPSAHAAALTRRDPMSTAYADPHALAVIGPVEPDSRALDDAYWCVECRSVGWLEYERGPYEWTDRCPKCTDHRGEPKPAHVCQCCCEPLRCDDATEVKVASESGRHWMHKACVAEWIAIGEQEALDAQEAMALRGAA
jgi:hypothetical protein